MRRLTPILVVLATTTALALQTSTRTVIRAGAGTQDLPFSPAVRAGDFIYTAGTLGTDDKGNVSGDVKAQTARALENLGTVLKAAGVDFKNVVSTTVHLKNPADAAAMNDAYKTKWRTDPPARTVVVVDDFVRPNALVEINMVAARNGVSRKVIRPAGWAAPAEPISYAVMAGDTLFVSGLPARNGADQSVVAGDVKVQTKAVMDNIGTILKAAGLSFADGAMGRVWVPDNRIFQDMNSVYHTYYEKDFPARATIKARFANPQDLVQISLVATKGAARQAFPAPINADGTAGRPNPNYAAAVRAGSRMFVTGMTGATANNAGDMKAQTRETVDKMVRMLKAGGFSAEDVVDVNVYITDGSKYAAMNDGYREVFPKDFPARTTVQAGNMGGAADLVEIVMTAGR